MHASYGATDGNDTRSIFHMHNVSKIYRIGDVEEKWSKTKGSGLPSWHPLTNMLISRVMPRPVRIEFYDPHTTSLHAQ